ncbi:alpha/beta hydrolase [Robiginitalea marina]|uniref:Lysophospholipase n=1 Tax=Robiginitalea marina TaxID=2954105 RepID=A0ABT1ATX1_9FLAO|nr:alpha/beta hydrolase [Robiginitalea marina]MCO5723424.1 lysophospholipase [Robiginitalea marina]
MDKVAKEDFTGVWEGVPIHGFWALPPAPNGMIVLVHGFGEHSGRYLDGVVPFFNDLNWGVFAFDLVGHGKSGGRRGHCQGYEQLLALVTRGFQTVRARMPGLPVVLFGHSMGGNLVLNTVLRELVDPGGIIASSPYLRLAFQPPAWKWQLGKLLEKVAPGVTVAAGLDPAGISRDPSEVKTYREDPLVHDRVSPRYSFPVIAAGEWALDHAAALSVPALLLHGTADPIIDPEGSRAFQGQSAMASLVLIEGGYHELHHDPDRKVYFEAIGEWMRMQFPPVPDGVASP